MCSHLICRAGSVAQVSATKPSIISTTGKVLRSSRSVKFQCSLSGSTLKADLCLRRPPPVSSPPPVPVRGCLPGFLMLRLHLRLKISALIIHAGGFTSSRSSGLAAPQPSAPQLLSQMDRSAAVHAPLPGHAAVDAVLPLIVSHADGLTSAGCCNHLCSA